MWVLVRGRPVGRRCGSSSDRTGPNALSLLGNDPLLRGNGAQMVEFMARYTKKNCAQALSINTHNLMADVLWRIANNGMESHDEDSPCPPVDPVFEKWLVTQKARSAWSFWVGGSTAGAWTHASPPAKKGTYGIKRNATQLKQYAVARCSQCGTM